MNLRSFTMYCWKVSDINKLLHSLVLLKKIHFELFIAIWWCRVIPLMMKRMMACLIRRLRTSSGSLSDPGTSILLPVSWRNNKRTSHILLKGKKGCLSVLNLRYGSFYNVMMYLKLSTSFLARRSPPWHIKTQW